MRRMGLAARQGEDTDIDLTPMLDVVFIMLIFFIVTASFVKEHGLDMSSPDKSDVPPSKDKSSIVVRIEETGRIWVEDTPLADVGGVMPNVKRLASQNPKAKVVIQPHPKSKTNIMIQVLDQSRAAGVDASIAAVDIQ